MRLACLFGSLLFITCLGFVVPTSFVGTQRVNEDKESLHAQKESLHDVKESLHGDTELLRKHPERFLRFKCQLVNTSSERIRNWSKVRIETLIVATAYHPQKPQKDLFTEKGEDSSFYVFIQKSYLDGGKVRIRLDLHADFPYRGKKVIETSNLSEHDKIVLPVYEIRGGQLVFKVISGITNRPLPGFALSLKVKNSSIALQMGKTDENGIVSRKVRDRKQIVSVCSFASPSRSIEEFEETKIKQEMFDKDNWPWILKTEKPQLTGCLRVKEKPEGKSLRYSGSAGYINYKAQGSANTGVTSGFSYVKNGKYAIHNIDRRSFANGKTQINFSLVKELAFNFYISHRNYLLDMGKPGVAKYNLVLRPIEQLRIEVTVVDIKTRNPISNARLDLRKREKTIEDFKSDSKGHISIENVKDLKLDCLIGHPRYFERRMKLVDLLGQGKRIELRHTFQASVKVHSGLGSVLPNKLVVGIKPIGLQSRPVEIFTKANSDGLAIVDEIPWHNRFVVWVLDGNSRALMHVKQCSYKELKNLDITLKERKRVHLSFKLSEAAKAVKAVSIIVEEDEFSIEALDIAVSKENTEFDIELPRRTYRVYLFCGLGRVFLGSIDLTTEIDRSKFTFRIESQRSTIGGYRRK